MKVRLALDGCGMRGVHTACVLDYLLQKGHFPCIVEVSAGASVAVSYVSKQYVRNREVMIDYRNNSESMSYKNILKKKRHFL